MNTGRILGLTLCVAIAACGDDGGGADTDGGTDTDVTAGSTQADDSGPSGTTSGSASAESGDTTAPTTESETGDTTADETTGDDTTGGGDPSAPQVPTPDGACPEFTNGVLQFSPAETGPREALVYFDPAAGGGGPVIFWFHGTGGSPDTSMNAISSDDLEAVVALGGMVVMPYNDPATGQFPWFLTSGGGDDDLHLMDEIVGCAAAGPGIDERQIHAAGFSAGGLHVAQAAVRRASYLASTVTISGGLYDANTPSDAPDQVINAMVFHGGVSDNVQGLSFQDASLLFAQVIEARGGYALVCDHGGGHGLIPERNLSWDFMQEHPYGTDPSPFESELPAWVPAFCEG